MTSVKTKAVRVLLVAVLTLVLSVVPMTAMAENMDPDNNDSQYAYGENVGWLNAEPLGDEGSGVHVTDNRLTGYLWAENIGWISVSCLDTFSCTTVNYGVANDGEGQLSGYGWGENVGWISFSCENTGSCGSVNFGVTIDPITGAFSGKAWGENIGWINFDLVSYWAVTSWEPSVNVCDGDFNWDGDVDGSDLATLANDVTRLPLSTFALEFGRVDCLQ